MRHGFIFSAACLRYLRLTPLPASTLAGRALPASLARALRSPRLPPSSSRIVICPRAHPAATSVAAAHPPYPPTSCIFPGPSDGMRGHGVDGTPSPAAILASMAPSQVGIVRHPLSRQIVIMSHRGQPWSTSAWAGGFLPRGVSCASTLAVYVRTYTYKAVPCRPGRLRTTTWGYINIWNLPPEYSVTSFFTTLLSTNHISLCKDSYPLLPY